MLQKYSKAKTQKNRNSLICLEVVFTGYLFIYLMKKKMFWGEIGGLVTMHPIIGSGARALVFFLGSVQRSITCDSHVNSGPWCFTHCHLLFQVMSNDHVAPLFRLPPFFNHSCSLLPHSLSVPEEPLFLPQSILHKHELTNLTTNKNIFYNLI